jgi:methionine synthase II (cobalamin-independent)
MNINFKPCGLPAWIGSLPLKDHAKAVSMMMEYTPDIPLWIQLPHFKSEGMIAQFLPGMPGLKIDEDRKFIQADDDSFDQEVLAFFEEYMGIIDDDSKLANSRFALTHEAAPGFFEFIKSLDAFEKPPVAIKGQITGPFTFATGIVDQDGRAIFYDDQLRDAAIKTIALKARWQVKQLKKYGVPVIMFLDEPGLTGFGSSAFISVSRQDVETCLEEVIAAIHEEGALAGVHVCGNAEWSIILDSSADIVSFDAYSFFDKFILYPEQINRFIEKGGIIAWGIVPTGDIEAAEKESVESLESLWENEVRQMEAIGIDRSRIIEQSLITPSCGTGSLPLDIAEKVIRMTRELSEKIRKI